MSRIQELLNQGTMIDVNLMSDQLKTILTELCTLVIKQGDEIQVLQNELQNLTSEKEFKEQLNLIKIQIQQINDDTQKTTNDSKEVRNQLMEFMDTMEKNVEDKITSTKTDIKTEVQTKIKDIEGQYFIVTEQIKNIWQKVGKAVDTDMAKMRTDLDNIQSIIDSHQKESPEIILHRIEQIERSVKEINQNSLKNNSNRENDIANLQKILNQHETTFSEEIKNLIQELKETKKAVVEQPSFDIDGKISTESLMNAITRNSRRIDGFNEIIMGIKNRNEQTVSTIAQYSKILQQMREQLVEFVNEHNNIKHTIVDQIDQCHMNTDSLRKEFHPIHQTIEKMMSSQRHSLNTIVSTFSSIYSYLGSISSKIPPRFETFDDEILENQELYESIMAEKELRKTIPSVLDSVLIKKENIQKNVGFFSDQADLDELIYDFEFPIDRIPDVNNQQNKNVKAISNKRMLHNEVVVQKRINQTSANSEKQRQNNNSDNTQNKADSQQTQLNSTPNNKVLIKEEDNLLNNKNYIELKQNIGELRISINRHETTITSIKKFIEDFQKKPPDNNCSGRALPPDVFQVVQKMINSIMKTFDYYLLKSEFEFYMNSNRILSTHSCNIPEMTVTNANIDSTDSPVTVPVGKQGGPDNTFKSPMKAPLPKLFKTPVQNDEARSSRARSHSMIAHQMIYGGAATQRYEQSPTQNDNIENMP